LKINGGSSVFPSILPDAERSAVASTPGGDPRCPTPSFDSRVRERHPGGARFGGRSAWRHRCAVASRGLLLVAPSQIDSGNFRRHGPIHSKRIYSVAPPGRWWGRRDWPARSQIVREVRRPHAWRDLLTKLRRLARCRESAIRCRRQEAHGRCGQQPGSRRFRKAAAQFDRRVLRAKC